MSVSDAKEMPSLCGAWKCTFEPIRRETANRLNSGDADVFEVSSPRWAMSFSMQHPSNADFAAMRAWILSLRGGQVSLLAWDRKHPRPQSYIGVSDLDSVTADSTTVTADSTAHTADETVLPWGNPQITAIDATNRVIALSGLTPNARITAGDPISWFDGRNWVLVKSIETQDASSGGVITDLNVEPRLAAHPGVTGYALPLYVRLEKPVAEMRIDPQSISIPSDSSYGGNVEFDAYQIIRRV
tara:strand:+ start:130 stop:858 length:729 start_codon:yes stop_codon:yes gene_type:complete